jgi:hypothetical protein
MSSSCGGDEILWIKDPFVPSFKVLRSNRVHVVDHGSYTNLVAGNPEIASMVSYENRPSYLMPLPRGIKHLIHPSRKAESSLTNLTAEIEIGKALFEGLKPLKLGIRSDSHGHNFTISPTASPT